MEPILFGQNSIFVIFDFAVVLLATVANCCVLLALTRCTFNLAGYRRFLISITASDLYICIINMFSLIFQLFSTSMADHPYLSCGANILRNLQLAGFFTNLLNLCGMSLDQFYGIVHPLKYRYLMNKNYSRYAVMAIWLTSFILAIIDIPVNIILYQNVVVEPAVSTQPAMSRLLPAPLPKSSQVFASTGVMTTEKMAATFFTTRKMAARLEQPLFVSSSHQGIRIRRNTIIEESYPSSTALLLKPTSEPAYDFYENEFKQFLQSRNNASTSPGSIGVPATAETKSLEFLNKLLAIIQQEEEEMRKNSPVDVCTFYHGTKMWFEIFIISLAVACLLFLIICYSVIINKVSKSGFDVSKKRSTTKLVFTTVMLLGVFMICWMPLIVFEMVMLILFQGDSSQADHGERERLLTKSWILQNTFNSLLRTYPLIDPLIYAVRIVAVRSEILMWLSKCFPCCSSCLDAYISKLNKSMSRKFTKSTKSFRHSKDKESMEKVSRLPSAGDTNSNLLEVRDSMAS